MPAPTLVGLSEAEAAARLSRDGPNTLPKGRGRSLRRIVVETAREPMLVLLLAAALLYLALGDLGEGLFMLFGAVAAVGLVVVQEVRGERALAALRSLGEPRARVVRAEGERRIAAAELVCGDLVLVGEGERVPADGLATSGAVGVDESVLTGESGPVPKTAEGDPRLSAGTLVVHGQASMQVTATGPRSALGRIGQALSAIGDEPTPLQLSARRVVRLLGAAALGFCALVAGAYGLLRHDWLGGGLAGVTVAASLIPEEVPAVLAIFLALGAGRLARRQILVRRGAVIEALGGATVLCVDKTGTLTENRMAVARMWTPGLETEVDAAPGEAADLLRVALLASAARPVDPMDRAIRALSASLPSDPLQPDEPERAWPLRPELLAVVQAWRQPDGTALAAAKGAPEAIFRLCRLEPRELERLHRVLARYADEGLRVLGVAVAGVEALDLDPLDVEFHFLGFLAFRDPLRADAAAALAEARGAGVKVMMITGDHPATALAIAAAAGVETAPGVLLGSDIDAASDEALAAHLWTVRVFARVRPEHKLRIVRALKAAGEVVAMTGDGVNDAPALQAADIGIAMGRRGSDVAREASDIVLLDDSFASIVAGVALGRRIFANLHRAMTYIVAVHIPVAGLALAPVLLGLPPLLAPLHVVLLELAIDPTCALVFEAEPSDAAAMRRPPRPRGEALVKRPEVLRAVLQGLVLLAVVLGLYVWVLGREGEAAARAAAFLTLAGGNLVLALADGATSGGLFAPHRRVFWAIATGVGAALAAILLAPPLAGLFAMRLPSPEALLLALAAALAAGGWSWVLPRLLRRRTPRR
jgi:Ca2+-transporting ATPase